MEQYGHLPRFSYTEEVAGPYEKNVGIQFESCSAYFRSPAVGDSWIKKYDGLDSFIGMEVALKIELGYFSLSELKSVKGPLGLPIERDLHFESKTLKELMEIHQKDRGEY